MAKKAPINRNEMRQASLVKQFAGQARRAEGDRQRRKLPLEERFEARLKLAKLPRNSSKTRIRNRCEVTGRPRAYYRKMKMSRIALRELGSRARSPASSSRAGEEGIMTM
jgi:small subunit ribosomal protein S14